MLSIFLVLSLIINVATILGLVRATRIIFKFEDNINDSLDLLDKSYQALAKIAKTPVLFDDPQVKSAIKELTTARDVILLIANKMTSNTNQIDDKNG
jgi:hypothetical protein